MKAFLSASTDHLHASLTSHGCTVGRYILTAFADRERGYALQEDVAGQPVALIASVLPATESLFDLLALHRLLRENGAGKIDLIVPYLGYARQDRRKERGTAGIGVMVAELLRRTKTEGLIVCDIHSERIRKALGRSAVEWTALPLFAAALAERPPEIVIAPDAGAVPRARRLAELLKPRPEVALIDKFRPRPNVAVALCLQGEVRHRHVLILDDMIDTGGTLVEAVNLVVAHGAATIRIAATHGVFSAGAEARLASLPVAEILVTDTLPQRRHPKIRCLDIVPSLLDLWRTTAGIT